MSRSARRKTSIGYDDGEDFVCDNNNNDCTNAFYYSSEATPLLESEAKERDRIRINANTNTNTNIILNNDESESEHQYQHQHQHRPNDSEDQEFVANCKNCGSDGDGSVREYVSSSFLSHCYHYHRQMMIPIVIAIIVFASSVALMGVSYYRYDILPSPPSHSIAAMVSGERFATPDQTGVTTAHTDAHRTTATHTNAARIEALRESLGSSLEDLPNAAVASDHPVCSKIGNDILQHKGGNAVDAAVATVLCLGVANPASSGLGGGSFLLVRSSRSHFEEKQKRNDNSPLPVFDDARDPNADDNHDDDQEFITEAIDCREVAPEESSRDMYNGLPASASELGGLAVPVPGELRGLELAHARHGRLPWSAVVEPSVVLARDGVVVGRHLASFIELLFTIWFPIIAKNSGDGVNNGIAGITRYLSTSRNSNSNISSKSSSKSNSNSNSDSHDGSTPPEFLREGEILRNPPLARTLSEIAKHGADAFYKGRIAENLVKDVRAAGGILTLNDMESYRAVLRTPVTASVSGYILVGVPPPSSGGAVVIAIARFLSGYTEPFASNDDGLSIHRMAEGMRHAFAIRMSLSDPAYHTNLTKAAVRDLTTTEYMESLRNLTHDDNVLSLSHYGGPKWALLHDEDGTKEAKDAHEGDRRHRTRRKLFRQQGSPESAFSAGGGGTSSSNTNNSKSNHQNREDTDQRHRKLARPFGYLEDSGTSHLSVVDSDGNAVAFTSSINNIFGSKVYSETTGVLLGNTMDDFGIPSGASNVYGLRPSEANFIVPGKRVRTYAAIEQYPSMNYSKRIQIQFQSSFLATHNCFGLALLTVE